MEDAKANELVQKIKADMVIAIKTRQSVQVSALRSLLARISNAEAVPTPNQTSPTSGRIAGAHLGVGSTEMPRKQLSYADLQTIIQGEIQEIEAAVGQLDESNSYAAELDQKLAILRSYLQ